MAKNGEDGIARVGKENLLFISSKNSLEVLKTLYSDVKLHIGMDSLKMDYIGFFMSKKCPLLAPFNKVCVLIF